MNRREQIGSTLRKARVAMGLSQTEVAAKFGVGQNTISNWEKGKVLPSPETLADLAAFLELEDFNPADFRESPARTPQSDMLPEIVQVPEYGVSVSAGGGAFAADDEVIGHWPFPRRFFETLGLSPQSSVMLTVWGDSMEPTLRTGAKIVINTLHCNPAQAGIYVIALEGVAVIKRLEIIPGSKPARLRISSDNKLHREYEVDAADVRVLGGLSAIISLI